MATKPVEKTTVFIYDATNKRGQKISGQINAKSMAIAKAQLKKQGLNVSKIQKKPFDLNTLFGAGSVKPLDVAIFVRQLATMMKAGVPLVQSFDIVNDSLENPAMRKVVNSLKTEVEAGTSLATAMRSHPKVFDELFISLVESGEQSGALEQMLDRVAIYKEKSELLKQKIKKAFKYPVTVLIVACIVSAILLIKVVPTFEDLFNGFGAKLPAFTQFVINISKSLRENGPMVLAIIVGIFFLLRYLIKNNKNVRNQLDAYILKAPIFGDLVYKSIIARFSRTLATTFAAGVPLIDALASTAGATNNAVYTKAIMKIREEIATGQQLQFAMRISNVFPNMAIQMVSIGEETGALDAMLDKVATYYENEVDNAVDGLTSMMEPLIMAFLGVVIGSLVVAMYLPIFAMGSVI